MFNKNGDKKSPFKSRQKSENINQPQVIFPAKDIKLFEPLTQQQKDSQQQKNIFSLATKGNFLSMNDNALQESLQMGQSPFFNAATMLGASSDIAQMQQQKQQQTLQNKPALPLSEAKQKQLIEDKKISLSDDIFTTSISVFNQTQKQQKETTQQPTLQQQQQVQQQQNSILNQKSFENVSSNIKQTTPKNVSLIQLQQTSEDSSKHKKMSSANNPFSQQISDSPNRNFINQQQLQQESSPPNKFTQRIQQQQKQQKQQELIQQQQQYMQEDSPLLNRYTDQALSQQKQQQDEELHRQGIERLKQQKYNIQQSQKFQIQKVIEESKQRDLQHQKEIQQQFHKLIYNNTNSTNNTSAVNAAINNQEESYSPNTKFRLQMQVLQNQYQNNELFINNIQTATSIESPTDKKQTFLNDHENNENFLDYQGIIGNLIKKIETMGEMIEKQSSINDNIINENTKWSEQYTKLKALFIKNLETGLIESGREDQLKNILGDQIIPDQLFYNTSKRKIEELEKTVKKYIDENRKLEEQLRKQEQEYLLKTIENRSNIIAAQDMIKSQSEEQTQKLKEQIIKMSNEMDRLMKYTNMTPEQRFLDLEKKYNELLVKQSSYQSQMQSLQNQLSNAQRNANSNEKNHQQQQQLEAQNAANIISAMTHSGNLSQGQTAIHRIEEEESDEPKQQSSQQGNTTKNKLQKNQQQLKSSFTNANNQTPSNHNHTQNKGQSASIQMKSTTPSQQQQQTIPTNQSVQLPLQKQRIAGPSQGFGKLKK